MTVSPLGDHLDVVWAAGEVELFVPRQLARPAKRLATHLAALDLEREVRLLDVIAQRLQVAEAGVADVTDMVLVNINRRLLDDAVTEALHHERETLLQRMKTINL